MVRKETANGTVRLSFESFLDCLSQIKMKKQAQIQISNRLTLVVIEMS